MGHSALNRPVRLAISPCPNDTFAFYALLHGKTDFKGNISCEYMDIEALNQACSTAEHDFCKVSFFAFLHMLETHFMLDSGAALGFGCGPLIVGKGPSRLEQTGRLSIAVPGLQTTANLLLNLYLKHTPGLTPNIRVMPFHRIMQAVADNKVDAGLIIHESRFTFQNYGLTQWVDLGARWEKTSGHAIPLGGIAVRRKLPRSTVLNFQKALEQSINYAWNHTEEVIPFMKCHAQEMNETVMMQHVELYVNKYTLTLGQTGRKSIEQLSREAQRTGLLKNVPDRPLFQARNFP
jgi:1,4-dihydroxy-6-naphthoate synthase